MRLRSEPGLVPAAVSETMRYEPSLGIIPRIVVEPIDIGGVERPAGMMVLLAVVTGNRDPEVWDGAERFDVERFTRPDVTRLLSFGSGKHFCLGTHLARMGVIGDRIRLEVSSPSGGHHGWSSEEEFWVA